MSKTDSMVSTLDSQRTVVGPLGYRTLFIATLSQTSISLAAQGVAVLSPFLTKSLGLARSEVGVVSGAVNIGMAFTVLLAGYAVDKWGDRRVLVAGALFAGLSIMLASLAGSFFALTALLMFTGFWVATSTPAGSRAIVKSFPKARRGFALGVRQTGVPLGGFIAALILPSIALRYNWQAAFLFGGAVCILSAVFAFIFYREVDAGVEDYPVSGAGRSRFDIFEFFANRDIMLTTLVAIVLVGAQFSVVTYMDLFLNEELGLPVRTASNFLSIALLAGVIGRILWGIISDTLLNGRRKVVMMGSLILLMLMSVAILFVSADTPLWLIAAIVFMFGFSAIGWNGIYIALLSELAGKNKEGTGIGTGMTLLQVGVLVVPPAFGHLVDTTGSYRYSWIMLGIFALLGALVLLLVREKDNSLQ